MATNHIPPFNPQDLEALAKILGATEGGLTGSEIGRLLQDTKIPDPTPEQTKWKRLYNAFATFQNRKKFGNHVVVFINHTMRPVGYTSQVNLFSERRDALNVVLAFSGMQVRRDGKVVRARKSDDLADAMQRASRLHAALSNRQVHPDVLRYCKPELLQENYFHGVFEATKSIAAKIRSLSGLSGDGAALVNAAFSLGKHQTPILAINSLTTETERSEQRGFGNLLLGLFGTVRNPLAHRPKQEWPMSEQDALDILTMASLIHRKLDRAQRYVPS